MRSWRPLIGRTSGAHTASCDREPHTRPVRKGLRHHVHGVSIDVVPCGIRPIRHAVGRRVGRRYGHGGSGEGIKRPTVTLQDGLKASEREGKPLSGKFEIEHDALQLSVYTLKGDDFIEVVADPKTGAIAKAEKITDADDLKAAAAQKAAMAKATVSLLAATDAAAKANAGLRTVSIYPQLQNGHAVAEVTLLQGTTLKKVMEKLD